MHKIPLLDIRISLPKQISAMRMYRTKRQQFFDAAVKAGYSKQEVSSFLKEKDNLHAVYKQCFCK